MEANTDTIIQLMIPSFFSNHALRVQVPNNHIHTRIKNVHYNYYYQYPKYLIIRYMDRQHVGTCMWP